MSNTTISEDGRFEWDDKKNKSNKKEHGFYFNEILCAFDDPCFLELYDDSHSTYEETRYKGLAELQDFVILYLSFTETAKGRTRLISARLAEPIEEDMYYEWRKNFNP